MLIALLCLSSPVASESVYTSEALLYTGMRMLNEDKMNELVLFINSLMQNSTINPFYYASETNTRILSGEEEGVFEWITINYLLGSFAS